MRNEFKKINKYLTHRQNQYIKYYESLENIFEKCLKNKYIYIIFE